MISAKEAKEQAELNNNYDTIHAQYESMYNQVKSSYLYSIEQKIKKAVKQGKQEVTILINIDDFEKRTKHLMKDVLFDIITELGDLGYIIYCKRGDNILTINHTLTISWRD